MQFEKNVPLPPAASAPRRPYKSRWAQVDDMAVGDSFRMDGGMSASVRSALRARAKKTGHKHSIREDGTGFRVWRIA